MAAMITAATATTAMMAPSPSLLSTSRLRASGLKGFAFSGSVGEFMFERLRVVAFGSQRRLIGLVPGPAAAGGTLAESSRSPPGGDAGEDANGRKSVRRAPDENNARRSSARNRA